VYSPANKIVLVTGASAGIGEACARAFAAAGANPILCARRLDRLEELAAKIRRQFGVRALPLALDVTEYQEVARTIENLPPEWREIEILRLVAEGCSNAEIAQSLFIAHSTAKRHIANILGKLGAQNRRQAVTLARSMGLLDLP